MKKSILAVVIAMNVASFANVSNADTGVYFTTPAAVSQAQTQAKTAGAEYHAALTAFNAAPLSERDYAAQRLDAATNAYQTAVIAEKVAIKDWLHPQAGSVTAAAPQDDSWKFKGETPAKYQNETTAAVHYKEPQNLPDQQTPATPAAYVRNGAPVVVHGSEPQNIDLSKYQGTPEAPKATAAKVIEREDAEPASFHPKGEAYAVPTKPAVAPAAVVEREDAEPASFHPKGEAYATPATPAAYVRNGAPVAVHGSEPQNLPDAVAPKAPVVVKDEGYGAPKEVHLLSTTTHAQAATVEIATPVVTTIAPTAKATTAPTTTTVAQASATTTGGAGGAPAANTPVMTSNQANVLLTQKANAAQQAAQQAQTLANTAQTTATGAQTTATTNGQNLQSFQDETANHFHDLDKAVSQNRKRASAGIAGVAAMANIPQVLNSQTFAIGAGVGTTDGETGLAVGFSARASEHTTVKAAVSNDTQHNFVVGAGVSYGW